MRSVLLGCAFLVAAAGSAFAQPWYGGGYGGGYRPPPPPVYGPRPGYGFYGPPAPTYFAPPQRRCWIRPGYWGPERVCRW